MMNYLSEGKSPMKLVDPPAPPPPEEVDAELLLLLFVLLLLVPPQTGSGVERATIPLLALFQISEENIKLQVILEIRRNKVNLILLLRG
jgi:hypothetical protein